MGLCWRSILSVIIKIVIFFTRRSKFGDIVRRLHHFGLSGVKVRFVTFLNFTTLVIIKLWPEDRDLGFMVFFNIVAYHFEGSVKYRPRKIIYAQEIFPRKTFHFHSAKRGTKILNADLQVSIILSVSLGFIISNELICQFSSVMIFALTILSSANETLSVFLRRIWEHCEFNTETLYQIILLKSCS